MARTSPVTHIEGMTNHMTTQRPEQRPAPGGLTRIRDGAILGGVAGGLARRLDVSPSWIRLGFIVTAFFGGLGALLYLVGWLAIPEEGADKSVAEDFLSGRTGSSAWLGIGLIVVAGAVLIGAADLFSFQLVFAAALFLAGFLLYRGQTGRDATTPGGSSPPDGETPPPGPLPARPAPAIPADPAADGPDIEPTPPVAAAWVSPVVETYRDPADGADTVTFPPATPPGATPPPPPPVAFDSVPPPPSPHVPSRPRSYLGRLTFAVLLITLGTMGLLHTVGNVDLDLGDYFAAGFIVIGAGLLVGTFFGRAHGLILVGLLASPLLFATAAVNIPIGGEWGQETVAPDRSETLQPEYEHGIGEFTLDLTQVELREDTTVAVEQGIGQLRVVLPDDASVSIEANVGAGAITLFGDEEGGFDHTRTFESTVAGEPTLHLDLDMGAGHIEITEN